MSKWRNNNNNIFIIWIIITVITIIIIYILLWVLFWLWIILILIWIIFIIHLLNEELDWYYEKPYYLKSIFSYIIWIALTLFILLYIWINLWKIDDTFLNWSKFSSNYVNVGKKWWNPNLEVNKEWIATQVINTQVQDDLIKQILNASDNIASWVVDWLHENLINTLNTIYHKN